jgi:hypothetical protein
MLWLHERRIKQTRLVCKKAVISRENVEGRQRPHSYRGYPTVLDCLSVIVAHVKMKICVTGIQP